MRQEDFRGRRYNTLATAPDDVADHHCSTDIHRDRRCGAELFVAIVTSESAVGGSQTRGLLTNAEELHAFYAVPSDVRDTTEQWTAPTKAITNANIGLKVQGFPIIGVGPMPEGRCDWSGLGIGEI